MATGFSLGGQCLQLEAAVALEPGEQLINGLIEGGGWQQRTVEIVAAILIAPFDILPKALPGAMNIAQGQQQALGGQVIEQGAALFEEQRQVVLDAGRPEPLAHLLIDALRGSADLEALPVTGAEQLDSILVGGKLVSWQQAYGGHRLAGALTVGIESADGIDLIIEEVDAIGLFRTHREEIQQGTAGGKLAMLEHLLHRIVAGLLQAPSQTMQIQLVARLHQQAEAVDEALRRCAQHQGGDRDDQQPLAHAGQMIKRLQPLGDDVLVRGEAVIGQGFPIGEQQHGTRGCLLAQQKLHLLLQAQGAGGIGDQQHHRMVMVGDQLGNGQRQATAFELAQGLMGAGFEQRRQRKQRSHGKNL